MSLFESHVVAEQSACMHTMHKIKDCQHRKIESSLYKSSNFLQLALIACCYRVASLVDTVTMDAIFVGHLISYLSVTYSIAKSISLNVRHEARIPQITRVIISMVDCLDACRVEVNKQLPFFKQLYRIGEKIDNLMVQSDRLV